MPAFWSGIGPTALEQRRALKLEDEAAAALRSYLNGAGGRRPAYQSGRGAEPPEVDTSWAAQLPDAVPESSSVAVEGIPEDAILSFTVAAARALNYLRGLLPERRRPGLVAQSFGLSAAERAQLRRAATAIEDPIGLLAHVDGLSTDHVDALRAVYPTLYGALGPLVGTAIAEHAQSLTGRQDASLSRLLGIQQSGLDLLKAPEAAAPGGRPPAAEPPDLVTSTQRIASQ